MATYTVSRDGQELGTYTAEELELALEAGTLEATDNVWHEGMAEPLPMTEAFEIDAETVVEEESPEMTAEAESPALEDAVDLEHLPEEVVEAATEVDEWDAGFVDSPAGHHEEEQVATEPEVIRPRQAGSAGLAKVAGLLVVVAMVLAGLALPAYQTKQENARLAPSLQTAREIMLAIHTYAADHGGAMPENLSQLTEKEGMPAAAVVNAMPAGATGEPGYTYFGTGLKSDAGAGEVILESNWTTPRKAVVVGLLDGTARVQQVQ
jgi:hypothetical protein